MTKKAEKQYCKVVRWRRVLTELGSCGTHNTAWELAGKPATLDGMVEWIDRPYELTGTYRHALIKFLEEPKWGYSSYPASRLAKKLHQDFWEGIVGSDSFTRSYLRQHMDLIKKILELESDARDLTEMGMS